MAFGHGPEGRTADLAGVGLNDILDSVGMPRYSREQYWEQGKELHDLALERLLSKEGPSWEDAPAFHGSYPEDREVSCLSLQASLDSGPGVLPMF